MSEFKNGAVVHFDITGPDEKSLHAFYGEAFDWQIDSKGPGYALVTPPPASDLKGAITESDSPGVSLGLVVEDLTASIDRVVELGGRMVMEPVDNGWVTKATVADPAGNVLTLIQR